LSILTCVGDRDNDPRSQRGRLEVVSTSSLPPLGMASNAQDQPE
jgi:hypothetical protein